MKRTLLFITLAGVTAGLLTGGFLGCRNDQGATKPAEEEKQEEKTVQSELYEEVEVSGDLSSYQIKYYEPSSIEDVAAPVEESDEPFQIVDFGPKEELPSEVKNPSIYVVFSQPVVPLERLGAPMTSSDLMEIDPPLKGVYRWYGTRLLSFDADEEALPQRQYTVTIKDSVESLGGKPLQGTRTFRFHTEYLSVRDFSVGVTRRMRDLNDVPPEEAKKIRILFSYPVNLDVIEDYLSVEAGNRGYGFTVTRPEDPEGRLDERYMKSTAVLHVEEEFPQNTTVRVTIRKGARSEADFIGIPDRIVKTFSTLKPFQYLSYDTYSWSFPRSEQGDAYPVYLEFSHPVEEEGFLQKIHTLPKMEITEENVEFWDKWVKLNGLPVEPESMYALFLDADIEDIYGRKLGSGEQVRVEVPPARRYAYFPNTGTRMLEAEFPGGVETPKKIVFEYQNVFDGVSKAGRIRNPYRSFDPAELETHDFSDAEKNERQFEVYEFDDLLNDEGKGWVGFSWNFEPKKRDGKRPSWGKRDLQLQVTDLGITVRHGYNKVVVLVTSLSTGEPVEGAAVKLMRKQAVKKTGETGKKGLAVFELEEGEYFKYFGDTSSSWKNHMRLYVEKGADRVEFEPNQSHDVWRANIYNTTYPTRIHKPKPVTYIFTDRGLYKPGETVSFRGIDRNLRYGDYSPYTGGYTVTVAEARYKGKEIARFQGETTDSGGFYSTFTLPEDADPGRYKIIYSRGDSQTTEYFRIAHFRRLSFSVDIDQPDITYYEGDTVSFNISAEYLAGGALSKGSYEVYWYKQPAWFYPSGDVWEGYRFGPSTYDSRKSLTTEEGSLPAVGKLNVKQETAADGVEGLPYRYGIEARISDVSNQIVAKQAETMVHPASFYIGADLENVLGTWYYFLEKGKEAEASLALVAPEGDLWKEQGRVQGEVTLTRFEWKLVQQQGVYGRIHTRWERVETVVEEKKVSLKDGRGAYRFTPPESGSYRLRITAEDGEGRKAVTDLEFYATGAGWVRWGSGDADTIDLKPDKKLYSPGDTAKILMQTPIPEGDYVITVEREGIIEERIQHIEGSAKLIEVPIEEDYLPVVYVSVASYTVRSEVPENSYFKPDLDKPKGLFGVTPLRVETDSRLIDLTIEPKEAVNLPGSEAEVVVTATRGGKPAEGVELAFLAVDRGVLDLINYHVPDPLSFFYSEDRFPLAVQGADSRSLLIDPVTYEVKNLYGGDNGGKMDEEEGAAGPSMKERKDFRATAVFEPFLTTGEDGKATVTFTLPDTLTTYRCTAVAVENDRFGLREHELKVQNPINVRTAFPRRLRYRDTAVGSVLVTNLDDRAHDVTVDVESDLLGVGGDESAGAGEGAAAVSDGSAAGGAARSKTVEVPADTTLEVPFRFVAAEPGDAEITVTTRSEVLNERLVKTMTVEKPYVFETFTTIGKTEPAAGAEGAEGPEGAAAGRAGEGLVLPSHVEDDEGSFSVTLSGSRVASLGEAIDYVLGYPYGCMEQRASRLIPLVLLEDYIDDFDLANPVEDIRGTVSEELGRWAGYQRTDGGFPFWPSRESVYSSYYASLRGAHLIILAQERGFDIPPELDIGRLLNFLNNPHSYVRKSSYFMLYNLYIQSLFGVPVGPEADRYFAKGDEIGISGYGFLGLTYLQTGRNGRAGQCLDRIMKFVRPGTRTVDLTETYESSYFYDSQVEQLALLLMLYASVDPDSDMVTRITNTLMDRQKGGVWKNTADTNWAIQAFASLLEAEGAGGPDFTARVVLGGEELVGTEIASVSQIEHRKFPLGGGALADFDRDKMYPLTFHKEGEGRLYYTASLRYAIPSEITFPRDEGIGVTCEITTLDGEKVEGRELTVGENYRMKAVVSSHRRRSYLALRVPIPSGAEVLDASFVTTPDYEEYEGDREHDWTRYVPFGKTILDNEVRYFWDEFPRGRQEVSFLFRTTSGGVYPTPPATAECMYEPEIFGRTRGRIFIIRRDD